MIELDDLKNIWSSNIESDIGKQSVEQEKIRTLLKNKSTNIIDKVRTNLLREIIMFCVCLLLVACVPVYLQTKANLKRTFLPNKLLASLYCSKSCFLILGCDCSILCSVIASISYRFYLYQTLFLTWYIYPPNLLTLFVNRYFHDVVVLFHFLIQVVHLDIA